MSDDTELSDAIQEILKSATSNFHEPITHTTVTKDLTPRVCTIPERCVWWIAKKEGTGDDQVMNRMLTCWIDEIPEQDAKVLAAKQKKEQQDPETTSESRELATCRAIWQIMHEQMMWVIIPFSERIRFHTINNRRNPDMLYDLIKSHTALNYLQRTTKTMEDGTLCVYADEADFTAANDVFTLLNGTAGGQESKMTKKESDLLGAYPAGPAGRVCDPGPAKVHRLVLLQYLPDDQRLQVPGEELYRAPGEVPGSFLYRPDRDDLGRSGALGPSQDRCVPVGPGTVPAVERWRCMLA